MVLWVLLLPSACHRQLQLYPSGECLGFLKSMSTPAKKSSEATSFLETTVSSVIFISVSVTRAAQWLMQATLRTRGMNGNIESLLLR